MTLAKRLWLYQADRFPLLRTVPLLAVFSAASINVSAFLGDRALPHFAAYTIGLSLALIIFFQLRAADELKDHEDDCRYRPERPIPSGLVSLRLIVSIGLILVPVAAVIAWAWHPRLIWLLAIVWFWLLLMTAEFGAPAWLKARPLLYLVSHMAIMPLIDLVLTGIEWVPGGAPSPTLWIFLALSLVNGCVLEIGRKTWSPDNERKGVDSYSRIWGPQRAALVWIFCVAVSAGLLATLGAALGHPVGMTAMAVFGLFACVGVGTMFRRKPSPRQQSRLDGASGLWVLMCYATAGFWPLLASGG